MKRNVLRLLFFVSLLFTGIIGKAQCINFESITDSIGWVLGSDHPGLPGMYAFYNSDTVVLNTAEGGENNYFYNSFPTTLFGTASSFSASFDFRMDSSGSCSDGLTFWFFTAGLSDLGDVSNEGCDLGFPDTSIGFALAMQTTVCRDDIYMKKINSTSYYYCSGSGGDTDIATPLTSQSFLTDGNWHHCIVNYDHGNITTSYDGGLVTMSGYSPILGTGHFGFMATNGGGWSRKCLKNIQVCAGLGTPTYASDSFGTYVNRLCNGPEIAIQTRTYNPSYNVATFYGDGTHDSSAFAAAMTGGYVVLSHNYMAPGSYTIKQKLYNGTVLFDSLSFLYENIFCATLPVKFYYDVNSDCLPESGEPFISQPILTEIDSNGVPVDTISAISGFYYDVHGTIGDVYSFKVLSAPGNFSVTCPSTAILYDSLVSGIFIYPIQYFGLQCSSGSAFDLSVNAVIPVTGVNDQWGNIYVQNAYCAPTNGTLTLHYSTKYMGTPTQVTPTPASVSVGAIVWDLSALTSTSSGPVELHWEGEHGSTPLTIGDTVRSYFSLSPFISDSDTTNNTQFIVDTVKAGCDPNEMWVAPGCIPTDVTPTALKYTIQFENTGNDTAHNIYVMDTLPANVDVSTMSLVMSTNEMYISKLKDAAGDNLLKFDFPNINLLDSSHHGQCDGAVIFNIKTKAGLADGAMINNRAGIYFDVNAVVMTNSAITTVGCPVSVNSVASVNNKVLTIQPNPAIDELTITATPNTFTSYTITNSVGTAVLADFISSPTTKLSIKALPAGIYYIRLTGDSGVEVRKFVKM